MNDGRVKQNNFIFKLVNIEAVYLYVFAMIVRGLYKAKFIIMVVCIQQ